MNKKKILVTGCGGMLGEAVFNYFKDKADVFPTDIDLNEKWLTYLDVREYDSIKKAILEIKPDYVFHLAAFTDLEYSEKHPNEAYLTNVIGTENIALLCREFNITMVYISTAGVVDGKKEFYTEYDDPNPLNIYGKTKYIGEKIVEKNLIKYFIFRAGWMMGGGEKKDKKFINKIIKQIKEGKKELFVVDDKLGTPTYTYNFVENIEVVINSPFYGLYHMVSEGGGSRLEVAKEILKILNVKDVNIIKVDSNYFKKEYFAPRPTSEQLTNFKLSLRGLNKARDWHINLRNYLLKYFKNYVKE
ncbi:Dtdp-4-dehydrorhamnose reductase [groundwater metagenome]|uniref:Dtdp-4-dehydrorhamnose reductase n=1 Tax=groundwater metagenome TaxID=717931 RepID=A0A098EEL8_9ZZZZ